MNAVITITCNSDGIDASLSVPTQAQLELWANKAVRETSIEANVGDDLELSVAFVDEARMRGLNNQYRGIDKPTNVLTFSAMEELADPSLQISGLLGDIVLCPKIVHNEANTQGKPVEHHYAHLLIHGVLHLAGMDHHAENEAEAMEQAEIQILSLLDIPDPYNPVFNQSK